MDFFLSLSFFYPLLFSTFLFCLIFAFARLLAHNKQYALEQQVGKATDATSGVQKYARAEVGWKTAHDLNGLKDWQTKYSKSSVAMFTCLEQHHLKSNVFLCGFHVKSVCSSGLFAIFLKMYYFAMRMFSHRS